MPKHGHPRRILTPNQIAEIRSLKGKMAQYDIAKKFGVKPGAVEYWQSHDKPPATLTDEQIRAIRSLAGTGSHKAIAEQVGLSMSKVQRVLAGTAYRDVA